MGIDDALALVFAYKSRMLEILAVCASGGNVLPERGIENLRFLYSLMEEEVVPLCVMGRKRPFRGRFTPIDEIHGKDGFGNVTSQREFRGCSRPLPLGTMTTLAQTIEESEDPVTLIALSPLTDVAVLLQRFPETKTHIREIILMGGGIRGIGNVTPCAEFNILSDPVAAQRVLRSRVPILLVPLDVTTMTRLLCAELERLRSSGSRLNEALARMLEYYFRFHADYEGFCGCYLHDVLTVGLAADRSLALDVRQVSLQVDTRRGLTLGQTIADLRERARNNDSNVCVVFAVEAARFVERLVSVISQPRPKASAGQPPEHSE